MIKLIASDLDGTLLRGGAQSLEPEVFTLVEKLKQKNILFVASSGRQYYNIRNLFDPVKEDIAYICENGSLGIFQNQIFSERHINPDTGRLIMQAIRDTKNCEILLSGTKSHYIEHPTKRYENHLRNIMKNDVATVDDLFEVDDVYLKISACDYHGIAYLDPIFKKRFGGLVTIALAGQEWLDMMPGGVHKGFTLEQLLKRLGIHPDECIAFGDQHNDIEMLTLAGESYAMADAVPELIEAADSITENVVETLSKRLGLSM